MISPELLRRYPFFANLENSHLKEISMISEEVNIPKGTLIFEEGKLVSALYLLMSGEVDLYFFVGVERDLKNRKEFLADDINVGETFGISALVDPFTYTASARATKDSRVIKIDANKLRRLTETDPSLSCRLMGQIAKALAERLRFTRIQLVAARS